MLSDILWVNNANRIHFLHCFNGWISHFFLSFFPIELIRHWCYMLTFVFFLSSSAIINGRGQLNGNEKKATFLSLWYVNKENKPRSNCIRVYISIYFPLRLHSHIFSSNMAEKLIVSFSLCSLHSSFEETMHFLLLKSFIFLGWCWGQTQCNWFYKDDYSTCKAKCCYQRKSYRISKRIQYKNGRMMFVWLSFISHLCLDFIFI